MLFLRGPNYLPNLTPPESVPLCARGHATPTTHPQPQPSWLLRHPPGPSASRASRSWSHGWAAFLSLQGTSDTANKSITPPHCRPLFLLSLPDPSFFHLEGTMAGAWRRSRKVRRKKDQSRAISGLIHGNWGAIFLVIRLRCDRISRPSGCNRRVLHVINCSPGVGK